MVNERGLPNQLEIDEESFIIFGVAELLSLILIIYSKSNRKAAFQKEAIFLGTSLMIHLLLQIISGRKPHRHYITTIRKVV